MKKMMLLSLLCSVSMRGMELPHDIIRSVIGEKADCQIECQIPVHDYKPVELPQDRASKPQRFVLEKEAGENTLAEKFVVRVLADSDLSAQSLLNDRKATIASGFQNFKEIGNKDIVEPIGFTLSASWVSYFDDNEKVNKVAYIQYAKGTKGAVGYEATVKLAVGMSVEEALKGLHKNYESRRMLILGVTN
jgi:hypothetical protein